MRSSLISLSAFIFCLVVLLSCPTTLEAKGYGYQLHSANDMREWHQWLRKIPTGVAGFPRMMKLDPHFVTNQNLCKASGVADERGCLLLSHDSPVDHVDSPYNSTTDVIHFLEQHAAKFENGNNILIALCFKDGPNPCDSPSSLSSSSSSSSSLENAASNWLSLVDDFFIAAEKLRNEKGVKVEFILDGDATPVPGRLCLKDKWRPWNSTWINSPLLALFSDSSSKGFDRFQILDDPEISLEWFALAETNFGKFGKGKYPILLWEPSDESRFEMLSRLYDLSHSSSTPPLTFAINVDISMFQIYTANFLKNTMHQNLPSFAQEGNLFEFAPLVAPVDGGRIVLFSYEQENKERIRKREAFINNDNDDSSRDAETKLERLMKEIQQQVSLKEDKVKVLAGIGSPDSMGEVKPVDFPTITWRPNSLSSSIAPRYFGFNSSFAENNNNNNNSSMTRVLASSGENWALFEVLSNSSVLSLFAQGVLSFEEEKEKKKEDSLPSSAPSFVPLSSSSLVSLSSMVLVDENRALRVTLEDHNQFFLQLFEYKDSETASSQSEDIVRDGKHNNNENNSKGGNFSSLTLKQLVNVSSVSEFDPISSISVALIENGGGRCGDELAQIAISWSSKTIISLALACLDLKSGSTSHVLSAPIDVGTSPSLSFLAASPSSSSSSPLLLSINSDGYCDNSHLHNTRATPRVCSALKQSFPRVLVYSFGRIEDWEGLLQSGSMVSSCHQRLLHGAFDQGLVPSATLLPPANPIDLPKAVVAHRGVGDDAGRGVLARPEAFALSAKVAPNGDIGQCGMPRKFDGLVLDEWNLPTAESLL